MTVTNSRRDIAKDYTPIISSSLNLKPIGVSAVISLLDQGATVPFIARYRKEATGCLDEVAVISVRDLLEQLKKLEARRSVILESLQERNLLSRELERDIRNADSMTRLEDLYLPFRPSRKTRASIAREKGLEPLALRILKQEGGDPQTYAVDFLDDEKGIKSTQDALAGASDIIAQVLSQDSGARERVRHLYWEKGYYRSRCVKGKEKEAAKFSDYFQWEERVKTAPSHRVLAMRRGEKMGFLSLAVVVPREELLSMVLQGVCRDRKTLEGILVTEAATDGINRLLAPSMETETRNRSRELAEREAIRVFASNLRNLLMAPPLGAHSVISIDPGFRTGCKLVCLGDDGSLVHHETIFPFASSSSARKAADTLLELQSRYQIDYIAVGNGTAGRETEKFLREAGLPGSVNVVMVSESGASVYSASELARKEFPHLDLTFRGAISIGRRLQDPLAELVKIDPRSLGVGQYQHDVDAKAMKKALDDTVTSCVNSVGVNVNTASVQLLSYVSGLDSSTALRMVRRRSKDGHFTDRLQLMEIRGMGPVRFQQCAGFLRIRNGSNPLDSTAVHPESYGTVERIADRLGVGIDDLIRDRSLRESVDARDFVDERTGLPTLIDIMAELDRPGRDPRKAFEVFKFADVHKIGDLKEGMWLPGIVTNVTNFGAFVDLGVHQDGLVHISEMSHEYVRDPGELVSPGDTVRVRVLSVDIQRGRISLSMVR